MAYATETDNFYRMQIVAKKFWVGAKRESQSGFRKQDGFFFVALCTTFHNWDVQDDLKKNFVLLFSSELTGTNIKEKSLPLSRLATPTLY